MYVAFTKWIGFTTDSGRNFIKRFITIGNVDYDGYPVNLTFGFSIRGVVAFDQNNLIVYGDYGFEPSILRSTNGGITFKLVYYIPFNPSWFGTINDMVFPNNGTSGFATIGDIILRTTNGGITWNENLVSANSRFDHLETDGGSTVLAYSIEHAPYKLFKSTNLGQSWQQISKPSGVLEYAQFISPNKGWDPYRFWKILLHF